MIRCFLIEDDLDDQEIFNIALEDVGKNIKCTIANDGPEAIDMLRNMETDIPDYIFIDVNMPKMNGLACLKEIKNLKHIDPAQVFMFSTTSDKNLIDICIELGACDFIVKPPALSVLTARLRQVFDEYDKIPK